VASAGKTLTRHFIRLAALAFAFMLSREQARFFDCNRIWWLSVLSGTVTLFLVYACGEVLYRITIADASREEKLKARLKVVLIGVAGVAVAGFFTMMTHICP
jgi:hypothetical protein